MAEVVIKPSAQGFTDFRVGESRCVHTGKVYGPGQQAAQRTPSPLLLKMDAHLTGQAFVFV